jgi:hypothetical protein
MDKQEELPESENSPIIITMMLLVMLFITRTINFTPCCGLILSYLVLPVNDRIL